MRFKITIIFIILSSFCVDAQTYNPLSYRFNGTPAHGIKIKTNIPFANGFAMPTVMLEGFDYGGGNVIDIKLNWYVYNGMFIKYNATSSGAYNPRIQLSNDNGKISIFITDKKYFTRFNVRVFSYGMRDTAAHYEGWTALDEPISGTHIKDVVYENTFGGKVGIGVDAPRAILDVGQVGAPGTLNTVFARLSEGNNQGDGTFLGVRGYATQGAVNTIKSFALEHSFYGKINSSINFYRGLSTTGGFITFSTASNNERMRIDPQGNIGIGVKDPDGWKLAVNGNIRAKEIKVEADWADFVFEKEYNLPTLEEVATHIAAYGHLKDIPSAATVAQEGIQLGEMNAKLLQKIEELTLYIIAQEKRLAQIEKILKEQR